MGRVTLPPAGVRSRSAAPAAVLLVVLALLLSGCGVFGSSSADEDDSSSPALTPRPVASGTPAPSPAADLARYYGQKLAWKGCRTKDRCADLRVPLDYAKPTGRTITLSVLKVPATDKNDRLGSMVINPGGPGGSGVDYAAAATTVFGQALRKAYDVVGFDPRGVGRSTPVSCGSDAQLNTYVQNDPEPTTAAERRRTDQLTRGLGERCLRDSGDLVRHVSTVEVAKDLDILRAALGDPMLTYFGASYGTYICAMYAELFPKRVGRMVLDGALDPASSTLEVDLVQAHGFEVALRAYVGACVDKGHCFLGSTVDQGVRRIGSLLDSIDRTSLPTKSGRRLTGGEALYGVLAPLYSKSLWPALDRGLQTALQGNGTVLMALADYYLDRTPKGRFTNNTFEVFNAVSCLDHDDGVPSSQIPRYLPRFEKAAPTLGASFAASLSACTVWPVHSGRQPAPVRVVGAPPILVVGTTRDPATPLVWARALARQIPDSVLVTRDGDGHTGYRQGSRCTDDTIERYLVSGIVPTRDIRCS
jgi:pimeloyl-ACP methyl ester carboxylesterase